MIAKNPWTQDEYNKARYDRGPRPRSVDWFVFSMVVMPIVAALVLR